MSHEYYGLEFTCYGICPNCGKETEQYYHWDTEYKQYDIHCICIGTSYTPIHCSKETGKQIILKMLEAQ